MIVSILIKYTGIGISAYIKHEKHLVPKSKMFIPTTMKGLQWFGICMTSRIDSICSVLCCMSGGIDMRVGRLLNLSQDHLSPTVTFTAFY